MALGWVPQELSIYPRILVQGKSGIVWAVLRAERTGTEKCDCVVPEVGGARRQTKRCGEDFVGRDEAATKHGGGNDSQAEGGAV